MNKDILEKIYEKLQDIETLLKKESNFIELIEGDSLEEELFKKTIQVYCEEEKLKREKGLKRKSSVRIYKNLMKKYISFFQRHMVNFIVEESNNHGLILFKKDDRYTGAVRILTDLGYHRKESFYNFTENMVNECLTYGINRRNIYIIVLSHENGLDKEFTKSLTGQDIDNKQLLKKENLDILKKYENRHIENLSRYLKEPYKQVFFLAGDIHPNIVANNYLNTRGLYEREYNWLSNPMENVLNELKKKN